MDPAALFARISNRLDAALAAMEWAEDEISKASRRFPEQADILYHAFTMLRPRDIGSGMSTEFVFRGHAREILERLAAGVDTRPATAAEICLALCEIGQAAPMHSAGAGLYFRMWLSAFPDHPITPAQADDQIHYERLHGVQIDELEQMMRRKVAATDRQLTDVDCPGRHHGQSVTCRYTSTAG